MVHTPGQPIYRWSVYMTGEVHFLSFSSLWRQTRVAELAHAAAFSETCLYFFRLSYFIKFGRQLWYSAVLELSLVSSFNKCAILAEIVVEPRSNISVKELRTEIYGSKLIAVRTFAGGDTSAQFKQLTSQVADTWFSILDLESFSYLVAANQWAAEIWLWLWGGGVGGGYYSSVLIVFARRRWLIVETKCRQIISIQNLSVSWV